MWVLYREEGREEGRVSCDRDNTVEVKPEMSQHDRNTAHSSSKLEADERKHGDHEWKSEDVY